MFYIQSTNQYVQPGQAFTINGVQYPGNWLQLSTPEEKAAAGIQEVVATNSPEDDRFYWVTSKVSGAELTYTNTPKDLGDLKTQWTATVNSTAYSLLSPSDWMVTKSIETGTPVAEAWTDYRASVRSTADSSRVAIADSESVDELKTTVTSIVWPNDPNYVPPGEATPA